jgi:hypothetical protein
MGDLLELIRYAVTGLFRSRAALQTEVFRPALISSATRLGTPLPAPFLGW